jgi:hypothetical protein
MKEIDDVTKFAIIISLNKLHMYVAGLLIMDKIQGSNSQDKISQALKLNRKVLNYCIENKIGTVEKTYKQEDNHYKVEYRLLLKGNYYFIKDEVYNMDNKDDMDKYKLIEDKILYYPEKEINEWKYIYYDDFSKYENYLNKLVNGEVI